MNEDQAYRLVRSVRNLAELVAAYARNQPDAYSHSSLEAANLVIELKELEEEVLKEFQSIGP